MSDIHPWVILLDIDGTLLTVDRTFNRPLIRDILDDLEIDYPNMEKEAFSGRTDHDILSSFLANHDFSEDLYQEIKKLYLQRTDDLMTSEHVLRHDYIDETLSYFDEIGAYVGLLTGNYPRSAKAKLRVANIDYDFKFGAFGEFDVDRNQLPMIALKEVEKKLNIDPDPSKFIIIGDTPRDVECANYAGMKSVAVTTGRFGVSDLEVLNPDLILNNLSDPKKWFKELTKG